MQGDPQGAFDEAQRGMAVNPAHAYDPAALGQCELLIDSLREAGLPEG